ncbi:MAG: DUF1538 domain-containing protein [Firmicutes bacterium]|nr:DUF1538 domain-containing protein [Bacillota bacterium]
MKPVSDVWKEAVGAILPMTLVIVLLQILVVRLPALEFLQFLIGVAFVLSGMFLFLLGSQTGLLLLGRLLGSELPSTSLPVYLIAAFALGTLVTVAEPDVRVLASQFAELSQGAVSKSILIGFVAIGVGVFVAVAMYRIVRGTPIRRVLTTGYLIMLAISFFTPPQFLPLAFDSGGVTTGPMTVPFILSLGAGTSAVLQGRSVLADGFGLVGLASLGPIIAVMLLGVWLG